GLPGDLDADRRRARRRGADDRAGPQRRRGRTPAAAGGRRPREAELGARAHARGDRIARRSRRRRGGRRASRSCNQRGGFVMGTWRGGRGLWVLAPAVAALAIAVGIGACGGGGGGIEGGGSTEAEAVKLESKPSGKVTISNWPLYIDKATVPDFEKATG